MANDLPDLLGLGEHVLFFIEESVLVGEVVLTVANGADRLFGFVSKGLGSA